MDLCGMRQQDPGGDRPAGVPGRSQRLEDQPCRDSLCRERNRRVERIDAMILPT
jgi:hypothetical protein